MDSIFIRQLRISAHIGHIPRERLEAQEIELDIDLRIAANRAGETLELSDTICYATAAQYVERLISERSWTLVEELAEHLTRELFRHFQLLKSVRIEVRKFILPNAEAAGIVIERSR